MKAIFFLARHDLRVALRDGGTLIWLVVMPILFFYFIGTATQSGGGVIGEKSVPLMVDNQDGGILGSHLERHLQQNMFVLSGPGAGDQKTRLLIIPPDFSDNILAATATKLSYRGLRDSVSNSYDLFRVQKSAYAMLADVIILAQQEGKQITPEALSLLADEKPLTTMQTTVAGKRIVPPSGFEQAIPGNLVMFVLLISLTTGASLLVMERRQNLLLRLASAPLSRGQIVAGKWLGRMALTLTKIAVGLLVGSFMFNMDWGHSFAMVVVVLIAWGAFATALAMLLGSWASTEGQVSGLGVFASLVLSALGGAWWPIEVAPGWMQTLSLFLPSGWVMDALHKLISFDAGAMSALPQVAALIIITMLISIYAARRFRFH